MSKFIAPKSKRNTPQKMPIQQKETMFDTRTKSMPQIFSKAQTKTKQKKENPYFFDEFLSSRGNKTSVLKSYLV